MNTPAQPKIENEAQINVEYREGNWIVKNNGDSTILFSALEREAAVKFAKEMAKHHKLKLKVFNAGERSESPDRKAEKPKINVEKRDGNWLVKKDGEERPLFKSHEKSEALNFVKALQKEQEIDLHVDID